jgi:hypothetical protein
VLHLHNKHAWRQQQRGKIDVAIIKCQQQCGYS